MRCLESAVLFIISTAACAVVPPGVENPAVKYQHELREARAAYTKSLPAWRAAVAEAKRAYAAEGRRCSTLPAVERKPCRVANDTRYRVTNRREVYAR